MNWTASNLVAVVSFVSVALLPWLYLWSRGPAIDLRDLVGVGLAWLVIGTFAAVNATDWRKRNDRS